MPHFAISIALERDGEIVAGVIYEPIRDEMFWAEKGVGAYVNDRRLRVSARRQLAEAVIGTGMPFRERGDHADLSRDAGRGDGGDQRRPPLWRRPRSISPMSRPGGSTGSGNSGCSRGTSPPGCCWCARRAAMSTDFAGGHGMLPSGDVLAANDHLHLPLLNS